MARMVDVDALIKAMGVHIYMQTEWTPATAWGVPIVDAEPVVRCKECKYFHYNKAYNIQGFSIMGNSVCDKWANGCRTDEDGYCFLGERREER